MIRIVVLFSVVLLYLQVLLDRAIILPASENIFTNIQNEATFFNHMDLNSSHGVVYVFGRHLIMMIIYYSIYCLLHNWRVNPYKTRKW
ncbi:hypothetical protein RJG79_02905 [Mycoplasmatota bacterium WC44]